MIANVDMIHCPNGQWLSMRQYRVPITTELAGSRECGRIHHSPLTRITKILSRIELKIETRSRYKSSDVLRIGYLMELSFSFLEAHDYYLAL